MLYATAAVGEAPPFRGFTGGMLPAATCVRGLPLPCLRVCGGRQPMHGQARPVTNVLPASMTLHYGKKRLFCLMLGGIDKSNLHCLLSEG